MRYQLTSVRKPRSSPINRCEGSTWLTAAKCPKIRVLHPCCRKGPSTNQHAVKSPLIIRYRQDHHRSCIARDTKTPESSNRWIRTFSSHRNHRLWVTFQTWPRTHTIHTYMSCTRDANKILQMTSSTEMSQIRVSDTSVILIKNIPARIRSKKMKSWSYRRITSILVRFFLISCTELMTKSFPLNRYQLQDHQSIIRYAKISTFPPLITAWSFLSPKISRWKKNLLPVGIRMGVLLVKLHRYKIVVSPRQWL